MSQWLGSRRAHKGDLEQNSNDDQDRWKVHEDCKWTNFDIRRRSGQPPHLRQSEFAFGRLCR